MLIETETTLLLCQCAAEQYALPMEAIREVIRWRVPTFIPGASPTILGVIHHHGVVLPIIDVRVLLGQALTPPSRATRLVIVQQGDVEAGLVVDAVADIAAVDRAAIEPPSALPATQAQFVNGLLFHNDQPVLLLAPDAIFRAVTATHGA